MIVIVLWIDEKDSGMDILLSGHRFESSLIRASPPPTPDKNYLPPLPPPVDSGRQCFTGRKLVPESRSLLQQLQLLQWLSGKLILELSIPASV